MKNYFEFVEKKANENFVCFAIKTFNRKNLLKLLELWKDASKLLKE